MVRILEEMHELPISRRGKITELWTRSVTQIGRLHSAVHSVDALQFQTKKFRDKVDYFGKVTSKTLSSFGSGVIYKTTIHYVFNILRTRT